MGLARWIALIGALVLVSACSSDGGKACTPGAQSTCGCATGSQGTQVCYLDGSGLGPCSCDDGGAGGSGGEGGTEAGGMGGTGGTGGTGGAGGSGGTGGTGGTGGGGACDYLTNTGCPDGKKCGVLRDAVDSFTYACVPSGDRAEDSSCTFGRTGPTTGYDNCAAGLSCGGGFCQKPCDRTTGAPNGGCAEGRACGKHTIGSSTYQSCGFACDPLTQRRSDGALACGSTNPASPDLGCYGTPRTPFSCERVINPTRTNGEPAADPGESTYFNNSCAPGFLPLVAKSEADSTIVCTALCQPEPTTLESHPAPGGAAAYSCARADAPQAECRYWWTLEATGSMDQLGNTLGYCLDYASFTFNSGSGEVALPSCTTLSSTAHTFDRTKSDAQFFGCTSL